MTGIFLTALLVSVIGVIGLFGALRGRRRRLATRPACNQYVVHWGWMRQKSDGFASFEDALSFYAAHRDDRCDALLLGAGADGEQGEAGAQLTSDGLTDEERELVEALG